jgi:hypothetical protein
MFFSLDEINAALCEELELMNNRPMKDHGGKTRRQRFEEVDKPHAQPLPAEPFRISRIKLDVLVAPNYHIRYEDHHYSIPYHLVGQRVNVYQMGQIIEIYHDNVHVCRHQLGRPNFDYTTTAQHMPPAHAFVKGWNKEWFLGQANKVGPATADAVTAVMRTRQHAEQGFNAAMGVLRLARVYGNKRLENACKRAVHYRAASSTRSIKSILEQHLDSQPLQSQPQMPVVMHQNIRGPQYYTESVTQQ